MVGGAIPGIGGVLWEKYIITSWSGKKARTMFSFLAKFGFFKKRLFRRMTSYVDVIKISVYAKLRPGL